MIEIFCYYLLYDIITMLAPTTREPHIYTVDISRNYVFPLSPLMGTMRLGAEKKFDRYILLILTVQQHRTGNSVSYQAHLFFRSHISKSHSLMGTVQLGAKKKKF